MSDTQLDAQVLEDSSSAETEEARSPEATGMTAGRMLANPRRVRRA